MPEVKDFGIIYLAQRCFSNDIEKKTLDYEEALLLGATLVCQDPHP